MVTSLKEEIFYFGDFTVDPSSLTISNANGKKQIEFRYMQLLCLFAQNENSVLTREQISQELWPDVVVGNDNITSAVFALRTALNDDAKKPKYIQTVPKKGYRFLPEVTFKSSSKIQISDATLKRWPARMLLPGLALAVILLLFYFYQHQSVEEPLSPERLTVEQLEPFTYQDGAEVSLAVNQSTGSLAYIHKKNGRFDIYSKQLQNGKPLRWTEDGHQKRALQWLNDDTLIFVRCIYIASHRECQIVSQSKGDPETVLYRTSRRLRYLTPYSREQQRWLFVELKNQESTELKEIDVTTREVKTWRDQYPELPKKKMFPSFDEKQQQLFFVKNEGGKSFLQQLDLKSSTETTLGQPFEQIQYFTGVNSEYGLIAGKTNGRSGLWLFNYVEQDLCLLVPTVVDEFINSAFLDLSNKVLYYASIRNNSDIVGLRINGDSIEEINGINSSLEDYYPSNDTEKKYVYFVSNRSGAHELWRFNYSNRQSEKLTELNATAFTRPLVSPNGQFVAFVVKAQEFRLVVFDTLLKNIVAETKVPLVQSLLSWSDDSRFFYTTEHYSSGKTRRYRAKDLAEEQSYDFATPLYQDVKHDNHVYYVDRRENVLLLENQSNNDKQAITQLVFPFKRLRPEKLLLVDQRLYVAQKDVTNTKESLYEYSLDPKEWGKTSDAGKEVLPLPASVWINHISHDGQSVLAVDKSQAYGDIFRVNLKGN